MFRIFIVFCLAAVTGFSQVLYRDLSADDLVVTGKVYRASEFLVDASGGGDFTTISQAVAHVDSLHAITPNTEISVHVAPGTYYEDITITKARIILRGDNRRAKIWGSITILETPTYLSELYIRSVDGRTPLVYKNINSATISTLSDCYLLNAISLDATTYTMEVTNSSVWVNLAGCEIYNGNTSSGSSSKSVVFGLHGTGGLEVFDCRLKTTSSYPTKNNDEFLAIMNSDISVQYENSIYLSVHDETPSVIVNGTSDISWSDSSIVNSQNPLIPLRIAGNSVNPIVYYNKSVGKFFVNGSMNLGPATNLQVTLSSNGTNTFQSDVNFVTSVVSISAVSISNTVYSMWVGYEGEYISETNRTGGEVPGKMYFIRKP